MPGEINGVDYSTSCRRLCHGEINGVGCSTSLFVRVVDLYLYREDLLAAVYCQYDSLQVKPFF